MKSHTSSANAHHGHDNVPAGYETLASHLTLLLTTYSPPFIYIRDPSTPRLTTCAVKSAVLSASAVDQEDFSVAQITTAYIDAVTCFTPRLFYDTVLNALADWHLRWEDGCENWSDTKGVGGQRWNDSLDGFLHGLQAVYSHLGAIEKSSISDSKPNKGKKKKPVQDEIETFKRLVLVIERAERLRDFVPELLVPLTRLAELVCIRFPHNCFRLTCELDRQVVILSPS